MLLVTILNDLFFRKLKELYTGRRMQSLFDKMEHQRASLFHNNGSNSMVGQQTDGEIPQNNVITDIQDTNDVDHH